MTYSYADIKDGVLNLLRKMSDLYKKSPSLSLEACKNAFALPLIQLLGYDIFNPLEVVPAGFQRADGSFIHDHFILKKGASPQIMVTCTMLPLLDKSCKVLEDYTKIVEEQVRDADVRVVIIITRTDLRFFLYPPKDSLGQKVISLLRLSMFLPDVAEIKVHNFSCSIKEYQTVSALIDYFVLFRKENFDLNEIIRLKFQPRLKEADLKMPSAEFVQHYADIVYQQIYKENLPPDRVKEFTEYVLLALKEIRKD